MRNILKVLNPFIFLINYFMYTSYMGVPGEFPRISDEPYDFDNDLKYF